VIHRCLRKHPDQRFQTMKEVQVALGALKHESDSGMLYRTRAGMDPWPKAKRFPVPLMTGVGAALAIVAIAGGGAWWWMHRAAKPVPPPVEVSVAPAQPVAVQPPPEATPVPPVAPPTDQPLTNENIIQMADAKVAPAIILSQIRNSKTAFNLSATEVIRLSKAGIPETVIEAMRNPKAAPPKPAAVSVPASPVPAAATPTPSAPTPAPPPAPVQAAAAPAVVTPTGAFVAVTLTDGLAFSITLAEDIPQNAEEGRPLRFTVTKDVRVGDMAVIAKGATVTGEIVQTARKGTFGIGGSKMTLRLLVAEAVDGHKYRVRPQSGRVADGKNERPVETNVKPKNKDLIAAAGSEYVAYIDGDVTMSVKK
jgi:hypothetical protein